MITLRDMMGYCCCIDPYTDFSIVSVKTGKVLVDRVHDRTNTVNDDSDLGKYIPYERKQIQSWETKKGKIIFYILPPKKKATSKSTPSKQ